MKRFLIILMLSVALMSLAAQQLNDPTQVWRNPQTNDFSEIQKQMESWYEDRDKGRGSGYKQWKRWETFTKHHLDDQGMLVNHAKRAFDEHHRYQATHEYHRSPVGNWTNIGPTDVTRVGSGHNSGHGLIHSVAFHPTDTGTIYVGTPAGGLWRTTDGGTSWTPLTDGLPRIGVSGIVVNRLNPSVIYILTGDGDGGDSPSIGVLKSNNGGQTWWSTGLTFPDHQRVGTFDMIMHPNDTSILFAATSRGLMRTLNAGQNWNTVLNGNVNDVEFRPGTPDTMYATRMAATGEFFRSTNSGANWTNAGITGTPVNADRIEIGVSPHNSSSVYLLAGPATAVGEFNGVYRSSDDGRSFTRQSNTPNILGYPTNGQDDQDQSTYDLALAVDPQNSARIITGGINVWRSTNSGSTMNNVTFWNDATPFINYIHPDIHELIYNPLDNRLFAASDGGIYVSDDHGDNWTDLTPGMSIMQFYEIAVSSQSGGTIVGGTQDNGTNISINSTNNFNHIEGADGFDCMIDYTSNSTVYLTTQSEIHYSTNSGGGITNITPPSPGIWDPTLHMHPSKTDIIYVAQTEIWRSTGWAFGFPIWDSVGVNGQTRMYQAIDSTNIFYAAGGGDLRRSGDFDSSTVTWTTISGNPGWGNDMTDFAVDPNNFRNIFVSFGGYTANNKIRWSSNAGNTWQDLNSSSLPNVPVLCIAYEPGSNRGVYVGTDIGVFYFDDNLGDWVPFRTNLPSVPVRDIEIDTANGHIYAGTHGRGLWRSNLHSFCPANISLTGQTPQGYSIYKADNSIQSTRITNSGFGTFSAYHAGNYVSLEPGFEVKAGNTFKGYIAPCWTGGVPDENSRQMSGTFAGTMPGVTMHSSLDASEEPESKVLVYPNPTVDIVNVEYYLPAYGQVTITIYDQNGNVAQRIESKGLQNGSYKNSLRVDKLPAGQYFVEINAGGLNEIIKLTKVH